MQFFPYFFLHFHFRVLFTNSTSPFKTLSSFTSTSRFYSPIPHPHFSLHFHFQVLFIHFHFQFSRFYRFHFHFHFPGFIQTLRLTYFCNFTKIYVNCGTVMYKLRKCIICGMRFLSFYFVNYFLSFFSSCHKK